MRSNLKSFRKDRKAASTAVSAIVITAVSVVLILVSSLYALQVLTTQQAKAEFEGIQTSFLVFDDAVRDIAWDLDASRSVRMATQFGHMRLIDSAKSFEIRNTLEPLYSFTTAVVKYQMPSGYGASGDVPPPAYILGDNRLVVSKLTESSGQALLIQESEQTSITLSYRVKVSERESIVIGSRTVNYVDIFVVRLKCETSNIPAGEFDLVCRNVGLTTITSEEYTIDAASSISVSDGDHSDTVYLTLTGDSVIFNLIIADLRVST
jgi:hypothetical protein